MGIWRNLVINLKVANADDIVCPCPTSNGMDHQELLQSLGLSKNEAKIYETLLRQGEVGVGVISEKSGVHRRNVYDSLNRLMEKGLVFEIVESAENKYQATEPKKLSEIVIEKLEAVDRELKKRRQVYPRLVANGTMTQALADRQIALMEAVKADYEIFAKRERLL